MPERNFKTELFASLSKCGSVPAFMRISDKWRSAAAIAREVESGSEIGQKIVVAYEHLIRKDEVFQVAKGKTEAQLTPDEKLLIDLWTGIMAAMSMAGTPASEDDPQAKQMTTIRYPENDK